MTDNHHPHVRLVSFVGTSAYNPIAWTLEGNTSTPQELFPFALCELLPEIDELVFLGTTEAKAKWHPHILDKKPDAKFVTLSKGATERERWALFDTVCSELQAPSPGGSRPTSLLLDVTHGFRSQPLLGFSAAAFMLSEWTRSRKDAPPLRILYGAFEAKSDSGVAPVWDLTELVAADRWNAALNALINYGRANELAVLAAKTSKLHIGRARSTGKTGNELAVESFIRDLGSAAQAFADDLVMVRQRSLMTGSAPKLVEVLKRPAAEQWSERLPVLRSSLASLRAKVAALCTEDIFSEDGLQKTANLITLYGDMQRYAEQSATLREALVSHYAWLTNADLRHDETLKDARQALERRWTQLVNTLRDTKKSKDDKLLLAPRLRENLELALQTVEPRNDIQHGGMNANPTKANTLINTLHALQQRYASLVERRERGERFVNISNHPIARWSSAQIEAARALGFGEPVDITEAVPMIHPQATSQEVTALVQRIVRTAINMRAGAAMVAGEYTLTMALVRELQQSGIRCFAATTAREAHEQQLPDDAVERRHIFRFVGFREYRNSAY